MGTGTGTGTGTGIGAGVVAAFGAIYLIWGSTYLAIAVAVADVPPVFMVAVRGMLAGGVLYLWVRSRGARPIEGRELLATVPTAALLFGGGFVLLGWAEQHVPSGPAALLNATTPAWVVLFEWLAGKRARPRARFIGALSMGIIGVAVLVSGRSGSGLPLLPAIALVAASVAWAAGTVRTLLHANGDPMRKAALQLLTGGLLLLPFSILAGDLAHVTAGLATSSLLALAYLVVAGSIIGYSAYVYLLHKVAASQVASHAYINPLIAVVVGAVLANEQVYFNAVIAATLILASVFFIVREGVARARPHPASRIPHPASRVPHPASRIPHPA